MAKLSEGYWRAALQVRSLNVAIGGLTDALVNLHDANPRPKPWPGMEDAVGLLGDARADLVDALKAAIELRDSLAG